MFQYKTIAKTKNKTSNKKHLSQSKNILYQPVSDLGLRISKYMLKKQDIYDNIYPINRDLLVGQIINTYKNHFEHLWNIATVKVNSKK